MSEQQSTIEALQKADITADDWPDGVLDKIQDKYARGHLDAKVGHLNGILPFNSEEFREELIEVAEYDIWGK